MTGVQTCALPIWRNQRSHSRHRSHSRSRHDKLLYLPSPVARSTGGQGFSDCPRPTEYAIVNLSTLNDRFEDGATVDAQALIDAGVLKKTLDGVKILGKGEITKALTVKVTAISESAKSKIEAAGGKVEVL